MAKKCRFAKVSKHTKLFIAKQAQNQAKKWLKYLLKRGQRFYRESVCDRKTV